MQEGGWLVSLESLHVSLLSKAHLTHLVNSRAQAGQRVIIFVFAQKDFCC